jgi:8-oxo-dGTP pyrophosphatase MutT (NUDIX family)
MTGAIDAVVRALHPLDSPPTAPGWNHARLAGLLGDVPRRDAAVLVAIRASAQPRVVFTLRRGNLAQHAGQVSFPGGGVEPGDADAVATALRESHEEIRLDPVLAEPLGYLDCLETISGYCVTPVVARLAGDAVLVPQPAEVASVFEVPLAFLLDARNLRQSDYWLRNQRREVYEYVGIEPRIWGATAMMLVNLLHRMEVDS